MNDERNFYFSNGIVSVPCDVISYDKIIQERTSNYNMVGYGKIEISHPTAEEYSVILIADTNYVIEGYSLEKILTSYWVRQFCLSKPLRLIERINDERHEYIIRNSDIYEHEGTDHIMMRIIKR